MTNRKIIYKERSVDMVQTALWLYKVIADENNHGRHTILETNNEFEAEALKRDVNKGLFGGCIQNAEVRKELAQWVKKN